MRTAPSLDDSTDPESAVTRGAGALLDRLLAKEGQETPKDIRKAVVKTTGLALKGDLKSLKTLEISHIIFINFR
jgi:hypothetical protein